MTVHDETVLHRDLTGVITRNSAGEYVVWLYQRFGSRRAMLRTLDLDEARRYLRDAAAADTGF